MTLLQLSRHVSPIWKPRVESVRKEIRIKNVIRIYVFPLRNRVPTTYTKLYVHCRMQMLQYLWSLLRAGRWTIMIFSCFWPLAEAAREDKITFFGMEEAALLRDFSSVAIELEADGGSLYYHHSFLSATMVIRSGIRWLIYTVLSFCCLGAPLYF